MRQRVYTESDKAKKLEYYRKNIVAETKRTLAWREYNKNAAINVLTHGEGTCRWCGQGDIDVLCIDHVNNDGAAHRKVVGHSNIVWWLIKNNYPPGFQVLCYNCNIKKKLLYERSLRDGGTLVRDAA